MFFTTFTSMGAYLQVNSLKCICKEGGVGAVDDKDLVVSSFMLTPDCSYTHRQSYLHIVRQYWVVPSYLPEFETTTTTTKLAVSKCYEPVFYATLG